MRLRELTADDVHQALAAMALRYSSAAVAMGHNALTRAIRHAEARDLVRRNVAMLVDTPKGQAGRPSKSLSLDQASALLAAVEGTRMHAYIALCLATGIRTEEARALRWQHVDFGDPAASAARAGERRRMAIRTGARGHQDREIAPDAGPARDGRRMRCGPTRSGKPRTSASRRARSGAIGISSSPPGRALPWTRLTSGGSSRRPARPRSIGASTGHRGSCGTRSCR